MKPLTAREAFHAAENERLRQSFTAMQTAANTRITELEQTVDALLLRHRPHHERKAKGTDAERLTAACSKALILLVDQVGMTDDDGTVIDEPTVDTNKLPLGGLRAARAAVDYLAMGYSILADAVDGTEPATDRLDDELDALLGGTS